MAREPIRKVYGVRFSHHGIDTAQHQGRAFVATTSQASAARLIGISASEMSTYGGRTWNDREIELAMARPETVLVWQRPTTHPNDVPATLAELDAKRDAKLSAPNG